MPTEHTDDILCPRCGVRWGKHLVPPVQKPTCPGPPRPDDLTELTKLVAQELRNRGLMAWANHTFVNVGRGHFTPYAMVWSEFDNLTPRECADVIQAEEAKRAAEWANDI